MEDRDDPNITKNINPRTHKCISLGMTLNLQGTQKVLFLNTLILLKSINIVPMLVLEQVIRKMNDWYKNQKEISMENN